MKITPCFAGVTPVTIDVWFAQVTVGFTGRMPLATAPCAARRRSVGSGRYGSSPAPSHEAVEADDDDVVAGVGSGARLRNQEDRCRSGEQQDGDEADQAVSHRHSLHECSVDDAFGPT